MLSYLAIPVVCVFTAVVVKYWDGIKKLYTAYTFFDKKYIVGNFRSIESLGWPYKTAQHDDVAEFDCSLANVKDLPTSFVFRCNSYNTKQWLSDHTTTGLVVLKIHSPTDAKLLYESYNYGNSKTTKVISWSLNKSFVSALIGIAIKEGKIKSVDDLVTSYVPELKLSGYHNVKIKDVLQMSSGVRFDETYDNSFSDINLMMYNILLGYNINNYICNLKSECESGTKHNYISADTQVLGMILRNVVNDNNLTAYFEEKLWKLGGFESDCDWLMDNTNNKMELAFGTLNACTRDYARFGWLYINKGLSPLDRERIIDEEWINVSVNARCTESHLSADYPNRLGYGYQWWIPGGPNKNEPRRGDYLAIGVYGQFIYVDPKNNIVIAKNSADYKYNSYVDKDGINVSELEAVELFRAMSDHYKY
jgi:CubicO group peptidase (beta-lactamase class C family)